MKRYKFCRPCNMTSDRKKTLKEEKEKTVREKTGIIRYFRELSIVIIGVLATLTITGMIGSYNRQKEIRGMMVFVSEELQLNLERLENIRERWEGEQRIFRLLQQYGSKWEQIPFDTLSKYSYAIGAIYSPSLTNDSYELLQSSLLIQYIKEKDLLRKLAETYRKLNNLYGQLTTYSEQKKSIFLNPMMESMDPENLEIWTNNALREIFRVSLQGKGFNRFLYVGQTILSPASIFEDNKRNLQEMIQKIEESRY